MRAELKRHLSEFPPPRAKQPGWYPDPLGTTGERFWDAEWLDLVRTSRLRLPPDLLAENGAGPRGRERKLPAVELPPLKKAVRKQRAREKEQRRRKQLIEAQKESFRATPAGRARRAFKRGQRVFQYEFELLDPTPVEIPGVDGEPPFATTDPVDVLNSVIVEGWKLETGSFVVLESRNTALGCYLFKRSKKRRRPTTDPWQS